MIDDDRVARSAFWTQWLPDLLLAVPALAVDPQGRHLEARMRGGLEETMGLLRLSLVAVALAGAVGLALSNPSMDDYLRFVEEELNRALDRMDQNTPAREQEFIRQVFRSQSKKLIEGVVRPATVRHNWGLWSRYETRVAETRLVVLGIGHRFIPIEGVEEATLKIGRMAF